MTQSSYTGEVTLDERVGQVMVVGFRGTSVSPDIVDLIQNDKVGGVILFSRNVRDAHQLLELTQGLQAVAKAASHRHPLLITIDQENGMVRRLGPGATVFPGNMAVGATGAEDIAYDIALATGRELMALGVNLNLAPVVDVNNNPANPVIGVRSFGEDPGQVARLGAAAVRGYHKAGVMTCLKHFPGHGDTAVDSHLALPAIPHTLDRLEEVELVPFRGGIAAGADSVMVAHIHFGSLMPRDALPATLASAIVRGLLRERLGFAGVIASDCLEMAAVAETVGTERGAVLGLQAGLDLIFVSHTYARQKGSVAAIRAAVGSGELAADDLRAAVERVARLKERYLSWDALPKPVVPAWVGGDAHRRLADRAYERAVTLLRNDEGLVPLRPRPEERLLVLYPRGGAVTRAEDSRGAGSGWAAAIRRRHSRVEDMAVSLSPAEDEQEVILRGAAESDVVIMATVNAHRYRGQAEVMRRLVGSGRRVIGVAVRDPYDLLAFPRLGTYLALYEDTAPALEAATRVLFGEVEPRGRLPVSLPGLYDASSGLGRG